MLSAVCGRVGSSGKVAGEVAQINISCSEISGVAQNGPLRLLKDRGLPAGENPGPIERDVMM